MQVIQRLRNWWKNLNDPAERARRKEIKKAEEMARFLDNNTQTDRDKST